MKRLTLFGHWKTGVLAGLLGLALASGGLRADPDDEFSANGPGGGVGTLPVTIDRGLVGLPTGPFAPFGGPGQFGTTTTPEAQPALALRGTAGELDALIALAYSPDGSGWFELSAPAPDGTRTITYHGRVVVLLERAVLQASSADVALAVEPEAHGRLALVRSGERRALRVLTTGLVRLPLHRAVRAGLLSAGLQLEVQTPGGAPSAAFAFSAEGRVIRMEQTH